MSTMDRSTRLPTTDEIARINRAHLIDTPLQPADLLFMFGTREDVALRADTAGGLWGPGAFFWSVVSGGGAGGGGGNQWASNKEGGGGGGGAGGAAPPGGAGP